MDTNKTSAFNDLLSKPLTGTTLAVASGLSFFSLCMILPLVGPAGSRVEHAGKNQAVFLLVLFITFALAALASGSKMARRKADGGSLPWFSFGLCAMCVVAGVVLFAGGFAI